MFATLNSFLWEFLSMEFTTFVTKWNLNNVYVIRLIIRDVTVISFAVSQWQSVSLSLWTCDNLIFSFSEKSVVFFQPQ